MTAVRHINIKNKARPLHNCLHMCHPQAFALLGLRMTEFFRGLKTGLLRKLCLVFFVMCLVVLTGCGREAGDVPCSDQLPNTWGCTYDDTAQKYNCDSGATLRVFQIVGIMTNQFARDSIDQLYTGIITSGFNNVAQMLILIYVALYGLFIISGVEQLKLYDAVIKLAKISIVSLMFSNAGLQIFNDLVVKLAIDGGNEVINWAGMKLGAAVDNVFGGSANPYTNGHSEVITLVNEIQNNIGSAVDPFGNPNGQFPPFAALDHVLMQLISPKAGAFYEACFFYFFYTISIKGFLVGILLILGTILFFLTARSIVYVYIVCLLGRIVLLGLAPIFAIFIIFKRTQQMFIQKWVVQVLAYTFIPVFMIIFLSVMAILTNIAFQDIFVDPNAVTAVGHPSGGVTEETKFKVCREQSSLFKFYYWKFGYYEPTLDDTGKVVGYVKSSMEGKEWYPLDIWKVLFFLGLIFVFNKSVSTIQAMVREVFGITLMADPSTIKPKRKELDVTKAGQNMMKAGTGRLKKGAGKVGSDAARLGARGIRRIGGF